MLLLCELKSCCIRRFLLDCEGSSIFRENGNLRNVSSSATNSSSPLIPRPVPRRNRDHDDDTMQLCARSSRRSVFPRLQHPSLKTRRLMTVRSPPDRFVQIPGRVRRGEDDDRPRPGLPALDPFVRSFGAVGRSTAPSLSVTGCLRLARLRAPAVPRRLNAALISRDAIHLHHQFGLHPSTRLVLSFAASRSDQRVDLVEENSAEGITAIVSRWSCQRGRIKHGRITGVRFTVVVAKWSWQSGHAKVVIPKWSYQGGHTKVVASRWSYQGGRIKAVVSRRSYRRWPYLGSRKEVLTIKT